MTGKSRSPAVVIAYLMKNKEWKLAQSYQWVKGRRPSVELAPVVYEQLQAYEQMIFGANTNTTSVMPVSQPSLSFGFPILNNPTPVPAFNNISAPSIFAQPALNMPPHEFTFGAGLVQHNPPPNKNPNDVSMDSS